MIKLNVWLELKGEMQRAGVIEGHGYEDAQFKYAAEFFGVCEKPVSISLPFQKTPFSPETTKNFFEGLLPEGFYRKTIADSLKTDEKDYLSILKELGRECIGALMITEDGDDIGPEDYVRLAGEAVKQLAEEGISRATDMLMSTHLSLTGASGKVGLYLDEKENAWYLPKGRAASTHIVKQSHIRLNQIVLNEQLCLLTAKKLGIDVPESFIINVEKAKEATPEDKDTLFATERYDRKLVDDRKIKGLPVPLRLHQEDFAQALGMAASKKYEKSPEGYLGKIFKLIRENSTDPIDDQKKLWDRILFNYIIGNTDGHIKNFSLLYNSAMNSVRLAPAYDVICTTLYGASREMSMYMGGEIDINKIDLNSVKKAAKEAKLGEKFAIKELSFLAENFEPAINWAAEELATVGFGDAHFIKEKILKNRLEALKI